MAKFRPWLYNLQNDIEDALESFYEDLEINCYIDDFGAKYSPDMKRLLSLPIEIDTYTVKDGTEIIFGDCSNSHISTLIIPDSVIAIWDDVFCGCDSLNTIVFGKGLKYIGERSFAGCSFASLNLPEGLEEIRKEAFAECNSLASLKIPESVVSFGENAFSGCPNLNCVYLTKNDFQKYKTKMPYFRGSFKFFDSDQTKNTPVLTTNTKKQITEDFIRAAKNAHYIKKKRQCLRGPFYDIYSLECEHNKTKESEEDNWYAMTDGMYGDYPDEGFDGDYESIGD